ncbi:MAG: endonuclease domain-containing protein, partial [Devosia sp.]|nr:endonuclease domain-containing protein [Devosia sp.]
MAHRQYSPPSPPSPLRGGIEGGGGAVGTDETADAIFANARHLRSRNVTRARQLRTVAAPPERHMWKLLRSFRDHKFRRQVPIGAYIVDFACHQAKLIVELDGETHFTAQAIERDRARTAWLNAAGYRVIRFTNSDIITNPDGVWTTIDAILAGLPPSPLRGGVGGGGPSAITAPPPPSIPPLRGEG